MDRLDGRLLFAVPRSAPAAPNLDVLLQAALEGRVVEVEYVGPSGVETRPIQPIGVMAQAGFWYCRAYCFSRSAMRLFRVDRVTRVTAVDAPAPLDRLVGATLADVADPGPSTDDIGIRLRLSKEGVRLLEHWPGTVVADDGTGTVTMTANRDALPFFARHLVAFGREVVVESPPELLAEVVRVAQEVVATHWHLQA